MLTDFFACKWPEDMDPMKEDVASHIDSLNDTLNPTYSSTGKGWERRLRDAATESGDHVVSFSHFLPRIELNCEKRFLYLPTLNHAVGSQYLQQRVEKLQPSLHLFGHTHFGWDATIDGIRYVQAALAYPQERKSRMASLDIGLADHGESIGKVT